MQIESGLYRHYKNSYYLVYKVASHSETGEQLVFYRCLYGDYSWWVRPLEMFCETVDVQGKEEPRFSLVASLTGSQLHIGMSEDVAAVENWLTTYLSERLSAELLL